MKDLKKVVWTDESLEDVLLIRRYLLSYFSRKEVVQFYLQLKNFESLVTSFPELFPVSSRTGLRRAVLNKNLSVYYRVRADLIEIIAISDNRSNDPSLFMEQMLPYEISRYLSPFHLV